MCKSNKRCRNGQFQAKKSLNLSQRTCMITKVSAKNFAFARPENSQSNIDLRARRMIAEVRLKEQRTGESNREPGRATEN